MNYGCDEDIELDDVDVDDTSATPRATIAGGSVFDHFVPTPELLQGVASAAAGVAASGAARVAAAVTSSLLPDFSRFDPPTIDRPSRERPERPDRPYVGNRPAVERPSAGGTTTTVPPGSLGQRRLMATRLPPSKYLKTDSIPAVDGSPQELDAFDISV